MKIKKIILIGIIAGLIEDIILLAMFGIPLTIKTLFGVAIFGIIMYILIKSSGGKNA